MAKLIKKSILAKEKQLLFQQCLKYSQDAENKANSEEIKIIDYNRFISKKSSLREPSVTRQITYLAYKVGTDFISLAEGMPNEQVFPFNRMVLSLKEGTEIVLEGRDLNTALQYIPSQGLPSLLEHLKMFQLRLHNPPSWDSTDLIVTNGAQDGIYKSMELLLEPGDPILVQCPTYSGTDSVLKPYSPEIISISEDADGVIPSELDSILHSRRMAGSKMPKAFYLIPTGSNPSGTVIPDDRRREIYELACEYDFIILEDDPYQFLFYEETRPRSFLSLDTEGRVLRFDSMSKVLSSGLRFGWVTGARSLVSVLELHMQASNLHSSTMTQVIMTKLFENWGYEGLMRHFSHVRDFYYSQRCLLEQACRNHLTGLAEWHVPKAGMFFWLKVRDVDDVYNMVVQKAFARGVILIPGHAFIFGTKSACPYIRLTFSKATAKDMDVATRHLADIIRDEQRRSRLREIGV